MNPWRTSYQYLLFEVPTTLIKLRIFSVIIKPDINIDRTETLTGKRETVGRGARHKRMELVIGALGHINQRIENKYRCSPVIKTDLETDVSVKSHFNATDAGDKPGCRSRREPAQSAWSLSESFGNYVVLMPEIDDR